MSDEMNKKIDDLKKEGYNKMDMFRNKQECLVATQSEKFMYKEFTVLFGEKEDKDFHCILYKN